MMRVSGPDGQVYEFPDGVSEEEMKSAMKRVYGGPSQEKPQEVQVDSERSWARPAGISTRGLVQGAIQGLGALGSLPLDAAYNVYAGLSSNADMGMPVTQRLAQNAQSAADAFGLPKAENTQERIMQGVGEGVGGAISGVGTGGALAAGGRALGNQTMQGIGRTMAAAPAAQGLSGAVAGGATQVASENGAGPIPSALVGMAAGAGTGAALSAANMANQAAKPFYGAGKRDIVGNLMRESAMDPQAAAQAARTAPQYVPGSQPTTAAASGDIGLLNLQRGLERTPRGAPHFGAQRSAQNAVRNAALDQVTPTPGALQGMTDARRTFADAATDFVFSNAKGPANVAPAFQEARRIAKTRFGNTTAARAALSRIDDELSRVAQISQNGDVMADPGMLYSARQNLADLFQGKDPQFTTVRTGQGENVNLTRSYAVVKPVLDKLDDAIEQAAPGFKKYMADYADQSKPIEQARVLQGIRDSTRSTGTADPRTGDPYLNLASLNRQIDSLKASRDFSKLTKQQQAVLRGISKDLSRDQAVDARGVVASGSATFQNIATGSFIAKMLGTKMGGALPRQIVKPLQWLASVPENQLQDLLIEAMLDPKIGAQMMEAATPQSVMSVSNEMQRLFAASQAATRTAIPTAVGADMERYRREMAQ